MVLKSMYMYTALSHMCMFLKSINMYIYLDLFQYKLQAKIIEEALATPGVEPMRSSYSLHVNTWVPFH